MALESVVVCVALSSGLLQCGAELQFGELDQKYEAVLGLVFFPLGTQTYSTSVCKKKII